MSGRIVVADDQPDILDALKLLLGGEGFDVTTAASPSELVSTLERSDFDVALIDLNYTRDTTSGREGLALLERARTIDPMLPVVVMTGWGSIDTAVEAMRRGAKSFVQKPWEDAVLIEVVQRELCGHVAVVPEAASILWKGGFPRRATVMARRAAQRAIAHVQRELQRLAVDEGSVALVVCDRGVLDGLAYWPGEPDEFFADLGTTRAGHGGRRGLGRGDVHDQRARRLRVRALISSC